MQEPKVIARTEIDRSGNKDLYVIGWRPSRTDAYNIQILYGTKEQANRRKEQIASVNHPYVIYLRKVDRV